MTMSNPSVSGSSAASSRNDNGSGSVSASNDTSSVVSKSGVDLHHLSTLSKKVADAELLWALNCVSSHFSASNVNINALFKKMFSDSEIAFMYSMSEMKFRYLTTFGLGPYLDWDHILLRFF